MADAGDGGDGGNGGQNSIAGDSPTTKRSVIKDRSCQFCGQAFTSSSLGRHLDLYIKEKNPKPPDGIHDVDAIRRLRGGITRRLPKSVLARRESGTPITPTGSVPRPSQSAASETTTFDPRLPSIPQSDPLTMDPTARYPFTHTWKATGVINDLPTAVRSSGSAGTWEGTTANTAQLDQTFSGARGTQLQLQQSSQAKRPIHQRQASKNYQRQQLEERQKLMDALDTARAAELALRELVGSWRAAKLHIDMKSTPFDFEPLSLNFPALTLQCLQAPPTLFSSTPYTTSTSWSLEAPGQKQYDALVAYIHEEFRKFRVACAATTTAITEELTYPPSANDAAPDVQERIKAAEDFASQMEAQLLKEHVPRAFQVWESLPQSRRTELWNLELARSVGRRQEQIENMRAEQHSLKQENANLKSQLDHLNRLQQPREFALMAPQNIPIDPELITCALDLGLKGHMGVGLNLDDRHSDLNAFVSRAVERWKKVVVTCRNQVATGQRRLDQPSGISPGGSAATIQAPVAVITSAPQQSQSEVKSMQHSHQNGASHLQGAATTASISVDSRSNTTTTPSAPASGSASAANGNMSEEDADAEMEDDGDYGQVSCNVANRDVPMQQQPPLDISSAHASHMQPFSVASHTGGQYANSAATMLSRSASGTPLQVNNGQHAHNTIHNSSSMVMKDDLAAVIQDMESGDY